MDKEKRPKDSEDVESDVNAGTVSKDKFIELLNDADDYNSYSSDDEEEN
jgi:hypothetical protein